VFPVRYELEFHIPENAILLSHRSENLKSYMVRKKIWVRFVGSFKACTAGPPDKSGMEGWALLFAGGGWRRRLWNIDVMN
jgi:hypothetical protein